MVYCGVAVYLIYMATSLFKAAFDQRPQESGPHSFDSFGDFLPYDLRFVPITPKTVDGAVKKWFETDNPIYMDAAGDDERKVVRVVFSTTEMRDLDSHDRHGQLTLPLISIRRTDATPIYDRTVASDDLGIANFRMYVQEYHNPTTNKKEYILNSVSDRNVPILETIEITPPKIMSFQYDVLCWANRMTDLNIMLTHIVEKFGNKHAVYVDDSLWFGARIEGISNVSNDEARGQEERVFKTSFNIIVEAPLIDKDTIRRYKSLQAVNLDINIGESSLSKAESDKMRSKIDWYRPGGRIYGKP